VADATSTMASAAPHMHLVGQPIVDFVEDDTRQGFFTALRFSTQVRLGELNSLDGADTAEPFKRLGCI
jgi:hypothetical protein